jgi:hypothetical protein
VPSSAYSFNLHYPRFSLRWSSGYLRLLHHLPVTYILPFIFPSVKCFSRQFVRKMWPLQLAFRLCIACRIFLSIYLPKIGLQGPKHVKGASQNNKYLWLRVKLFWLFILFYFILFYFILTEVKLEYIEVRKGLTDRFGFQTGDCIRISNYLLLTN